MPLRERVKSIHMAIEGRTFPGPIADPRHHGQVAVRRIQGVGGVIQVATAGPEPVPGLKTLVGAGTMVSKVWLDIDRLSGGSGRLVLEDVQILPGPGDCPPGFACEPVDCVDFGAPAIPVDLMTGDCPPGFICEATGFCPPCEAGMTLHLSKARRSYWLR